MIGYKIALFSHLYYSLDPRNYYFLYFSKDVLDDIFEGLETKTRPYLNYAYSAFDKEEDLDLFKARAVHKRLTELGVDCAIVKVDYEKQTFEQID